MMFAAPILVHVRKPRYFERFLHVVEQVLLVDRLGQESERAALRRVHGIGNRAVRGENDDAQSGPAALQLLEESDAVHLIHAQVRDHEIGPEPGARGERGRRALDRLDLVVLRAQADGQQAQQPRVVIDHQDACLALLRGIVAAAGLQAER